MLYLHCPYRKHSSSPSILAGFGEWGKWAGVAWVLAAGVATISCSGVSTMAATGLVLRGDHFVLVKTLVVGQVAAFGGGTVALARWDVDLLVQHGTSADASDSCFTRWRFLGSDFWRWCCGHLLFSWVNSAAVGDYSHFGGS